MPRSSESRDPWLGMSEGIQGDCLGYGLSGLGFT